MVHSNWVIWGECTKECIDYNMGGVHENHQGPAMPWASIPWPQGGWGGAFTRQREILQEKSWLWGGGLRAELWVFLQGDSRFACVHVTRLNYIPQNPLLGGVWSGRAMERRVCGIWRVTWSPFVARTLCLHSSAGFPPWPGGGRSPRGSALIPFPWFFLQLLQLWARHVFSSMMRFSLAAAVTKTRETKTDSSFCPAACTTAHPCGFQLVLILPHFTSPFLPDGPLCGPQAPACDTETTVVWRLLNVTCCLKGLWSNPWNKCSCVCRQTWASLVARGKDSSCSTEAAGDLGLMPGSGRSPGEGHGNPLQYSCLEYPMDRGAWGATVYRIEKSWTRLEWLSMHVARHPHTNASICTSPSGSACLFLAWIAVTKHCRQGIL